MFRIVIILVALVLTAGVAHGQTIVGDWEGTLKVGASTLRLVLHITQDKDGLVASLDSPNQGVVNVPVPEASFKDSKLTLTIDVIAGSYEGTLHANGNLLEGTWSQGDQSLPLTFARVPPP